MDYLLVFEACWPLGGLLWEAPWPPGAVLGRSWRLLGGTLEAIMNHLVLSCAILEACWAI